MQLPVKRLCSNAARICFVGAARITFVGASRICTPWLCLALWLLAPVVGLCQTEDPGSQLIYDSLSVKTNNPDSTHHTDTTHYHFSYAATGILNNTNTLNSYIFNNALKISMVTKSIAVNLNGSWIYGYENGVLTNNDFSSSLDASLYETIRHFYYWGMANYNTSVSLLINSQVQMGAGPGYNVIDKKTAVLLVSDGILFEKGDLYDSLYGGGNGNTYQRDIYQTVRNSFRILYHWVIKGTYTLDGTGFLQNALDHWNDYILRLNASASIKLNKWLNFTVTAVHNKFTRTRSENTQVTFGITVKK